MRLLDDIEVMDTAGRVLARARLPEGVAGMARLHELIGLHLGEDAEGAQVVIGIETDRGPWVAALVAAGYAVFPVNPRQASRYRERHGVSGARSDGPDAHVLADMVRTDSHQLRPAAGDSPQAGGIKVLARAHKTLIWDRTRHVQRLRHQLREYFPAARHRGSVAASSAGGDLHPARKYQPSTAAVKGSNILCPRPSTGAHSVLRIKRGSAALRRDGAARAALWLEAPLARTRPAFRAGPRAQEAHPRFPVIRRALAGRLALER
jgi:hypothetical protein